MDGQKVVGRLTKICNKLTAGCAGLRRHDHDILNGLPAVALGEREVRLRQGFGGQPSRECRAKAGEPGGNRTHNPQIKS